MLIYHWYAFANLLHKLLVQYVLFTRKTLWIFRIISRRVLFMFLVTSGFVGKSGVLHYNLSTYREDFLIASFFNFGALGFFRSPKALTCEASPAEGTDCSGGVIVAAAASSVLSAGTSCVGATLVFTVDGSTTTLD